MLIYHGMLIQFKYFPAHGITFTQMEWLENSSVATAIYMGGEEIKYYMDSYFPVMTFGVYLVIVIVLIVKVSGWA